MSRTNGPNRDSAPATVIEQDRVVAEDECLSVEGDLVVEPGVTITVHGVMESGKAKP